MNQRAHVVLLTVPYFLAISGALANIYWIPTFVKRLSGFSDRAVTSLLIIPALIGIVGMLANSWHSDRRSERRLHSAIPLLIAGGMYGLLIPARHGRRPQPVGQYFGARIH